MMCLSKYTCTIDSIVTLFEVPPHFQVTYSMTSQQEGMRNDAPSSSWAADGKASLCCAAAPLSSLGALLSSAGMAS